MARFPGWGMGTVPAGTYRGIDYSLDTPVIPSILVCLDTVPEDVMYDITKAILENPDKMVAIHKLGKEWCKEFATRGIVGIVDFHPGAEKYLKEQGLL